MSIFQTSKMKQREGLPIFALLRKRAVKGDIGIEIECEGNKFQKINLPEPWTYHKDGSLRGQDNAEYVLARPISFDDVEKAVSDLWQMFADYGTVLDDSNRTSVHVHLNVQQFHLDRLAAFLGMWFALEEPLTAFCGEHRVGNLFCLRGSDAPAIVTQVKKFIQSDGQWELRDGLHYAGLNVQALAKFGSIEIRTLRGATDPSCILKWVEIVRRLYDYSAEFEDPRLLCDLFSGNIQGPIGFFNQVLGPDLAAEVRQGIDYSDQQLGQSILNGIRLSQDICYCREWSEYTKADVKTDPFGRIEKASPYLLDPESASIQPMTHSHYQGIAAAIQAHQTSINLQPTAQPWPAWATAPEEEPEEEYYEPDTDYDPFEDEDD